jgi:hypothetical protein
MLVDVKQYILWLNIAMNQLIIVQMADSLEDLTYDALTFGLRHLCGCDEKVEELSTLTHWHHNEEGGGILQDLEDVKHMRTLVSHALELRHDLSPSPLAVFVGLLCPDLDDYLLSVSATATL